jgi:signal transduction histidine kinase
MLGSTLVAGRERGPGVRFVCMTELAERHESVARWQRRLLPGELLETSEGRRSVRDWVVDVLVFLAAIGVGVAVLVEIRHDHDDLTLLLDAVAGTAVCASLWIRRRYPVGVAVAAIAIGAFSGMAAGAGLIAIFNAALRSSRRALLGIVALAVVSFSTFALLYPGAGSFVTQMLFSVLCVAVAIGWGLFTRVRRELVFSLRERAERVESEQRLRVEQAREAERRRIAREMHDVLAHRLSLLSVHAGALEFRPDADPGEVAEAAGVIRAAAQAALDELRDVIGVLRDDAEEAALQPPQPTLAQLPALIEESRAAGMQIRSRIALPEGELPAALGRTAYRVVQEGLTNARKHAPGAAVQVTVSAQDGSALVVEVVSRRAFGAPVAPAGGGAGLVGLAERVSLAGGELTHGPNVAGDFVLRATCPGRRERADSRPARGRRRARALGPEDDARWR